jgi:hypothetical protein
MGSGKGRFWRHFVPSYPQPQNYIGIPKKEPQPWRRGSVIAAEIEVKRRNHKLFVTWGTNNPRGCVRGAPLLGLLIPGPHNGKMAETNALHLQFQRLNNCTG